MNRVWVLTVASLCFPLAAAAQDLQPLLEKALPAETVQTLDAVNSGINTFFDLKNGAVQNFFQMPYLEEARSAAERYGSQGISAVRQWDSAAGADPDRAEARLWNSIREKAAALGRSALALPGEVWADLRGLWSGFERMCKGKHILCVL